MKHEVTATDILVPVREVLNKYLEHIYDDEPPVYVCDVIKTEFNRHKIACGALGHGYNVIVQQMCYMLGVSSHEAELEGLEWLWGIEDACSLSELTEFYREGNHIVYGYVHGVYSSHFQEYPRERSLVRIGMLHRMIENFGEGAVFCIPLKGE